MPIQFVESTVSYTRIKEHLRRFTMKVNVWNPLNMRVPILREYFVAGDLENWNSLPQKFEVICAKNTRAIH